MSPWRNTQSRSLISPRAFRNLEVWCLDLRVSIREGEGVDLSPDRVRFNRVASENVFQPLHPETGASLHVKRVIAAADLMCILSSASVMSLLNVITCDASCCMLVSQSFQEVFNVAWKLENAVPPVIALSFHSSATEDVDHEAFWWNADTLETSCVCVTECTGGGQVA